MDLKNNELNIFTFSYDISFIFLSILIILTIVSLFIPGLPYLHGDDWSNYISLEDKISLIFLPISFFCLSSIGFISKLHTDLLKRKVGILISKKIPRFLLIGMWTMSSCIVFLHLFLLYCFVNLNFRLYTNYFSYFYIILCTSIFFIFLSVFILKYVELPELS